MRFKFFAAALLGALTFAVAAPAQAQYYYRRRPAARATARIALPPYGYPRPAYGPRPYYYPYARPRPYYYGPRGFYGPGYSGWGYGPGFSVGIGVF